MISEEASFCKDGHVFNGSGMVEALEVEVRAQNWIGLIQIEKGNFISVFIKLLQGYNCSTLVNICRLYNL